MRSEFWAGLESDPYAASLEDKQKILAGLMMRVQMGQKLERNEELQMCKEMKESNDIWRTTNMRLRYAEDFQALENFKFVEARLKREGMNMDMIEGLMVWQPQQMEAMFERRPPPPMPAGLDLQVIQQVSQRMPSIMNSFGSAPGVTSSPFPEGCSAFESELVQEEYKALVQDHEQILVFGKGYRSFDPRGKEAFLDQISNIEDRWRILLTRFQLMGQLNPDYVSEYEAYLKRIGLTIVEFNELLRAAHDLMRKEAEQEGLQR